MSNELISVLGGTIRNSRDLNTNNPVHWTLYDKTEDAVTSLKFQDGGPSDKGANGFTIEDLLAICHERIELVNSCVPVEENIQAMNLIRQAQELLNQRYLRRLAEAAE